jgi:transposase-like protein
MTDLMPEQLVDLDEVGGVSAPSASDGLDAVDEQLIARLAGKAREGGLALTGEGGLLAQLTKRLVESALDGELTDHLGYGKHDAAGRDGGNSRNGHRSKTVLTEVGPVEIDVPRDRDGSFEPRIVAKRQRRLSGVDELVISLSAKGLTTGEVQAHLAEVYGAEVSRQTISTITDKVVEGMAEWQNRPLDPVYPVVFIDAINVKIRDGKVANRPVYVALAVTCEGRRDILGLWAGEAPSVTGGQVGEGAKYWLHVLTEIKNRGVGDVLMVVCDGLTGLPDAIAAVWPATITQTCVVHLLRNSFRSAESPGPAASTTTRSPRPCARSTPHPPRPRRWSGSWSSARPGASATRRSCGCGRTPGRSSSRSWPSTWRSARSSAPPTRSRA